ALKSAPGNIDFQNLADQAKREAQNKLAADSLATAVKGGDNQGAKEAFKKITSDSVYYEKARTMHDKMRDDYVAKEVASAKTNADKHDCEWIETRKKQLLWDEAKTAVDAIECDKGGGGNGGNGGNGGTSG